MKAMVFIAEQIDPSEVRVQTSWVQFLLHASTASTITSGPICKCHDAEMVDCSTTTPCVVTVVFTGGSCLD